MADSTRIATDPKGERQDREAHRRRAARQELTSGIEERGLQAVVRMVNEDAPLRLGGRELSAAHIAYQSALVLGGMWTQRRPMRASETATFRILGGLAARAGLEEEQALSALEAATETMLAVVEGDGRHGPYGPRLAGVVVAGLRADARSFAETAEAELHIGLSVEGQFGHDLQGVLVGIVDGLIAADELAPAANVVGLDVSRPHGVVCLVHARGATERAAEAARAIVERVPFAVDLGLGDGLPIHRRVVVPHLTPGQWLDARTDVHDLAMRHGVLAVAPAAAPSLAGLLATYRRTAADLAATVGACGYQAGIIDPACIGTGERTATQAVPTAA
jgi:hypothetical protein